MSILAHHPFYAANDDGFGNFGGLVRFINDWDKHCSQGGGSQDGQSRQSRRTTPTFTPRFDVRETGEDYELHGELPGVDKRDIHIEFSDAQTIVIRGSVKRTHTAGSPPASLLSDVSMSGAISNESHGEQSSDNRSDNSRHATVEDETEADEDTHKAGVQVHDPAKPEPKYKYWAWERSVGNFSRTFTFPSRVDQEHVAASMDNGILTVTVPKAKKPETRRIAIH